MNESEETFKSKYISASVSFDPLSQKLSAPRDAAVRSRPILFLFLFTTFRQSIHVFVSLEL